MREASVRRASIVTHVDPTRQHLEKESNWQMLTVLLGHAEAPCKTCHGRPFHETVKSSNLRLIAPLSLPMLGITRVFSPSALCQLFQFRKALSLWVGILH